MPRSTVFGPATAIAAALGLAGCSTPYALKVSDADLKSAPMPGTITFSGPKLYRREALVNERREESVYLDDLVKASKDAKFPPEIVRQLELVKVLSASIGLKFEPATGAQNRRAEERAEIQQDIDTLRLEMQLDKLRRDAALLKEQSDKQPEPSPDSGDGGAGAGDTNAKPVDVSAPALEELQTAITELRKFLATDFGDDAHALTPLKVDEDKFANPIDAFNDRAVYRELLNAARNANSLDELHDRDGSALVRLNMTATVFPPQRAYRATFGRLNMRVMRPDNRDPAFMGLYRDWLHYLSLRMSQRRPNGGIELSTLGGALSGRPDLLDVVRFEFGEQPGTSCRGLAIPSTESPADGCKVVHLATPRVPLYGSSRNYSVSLQQLADKFTDRSLDYGALFKAMADDARLSDFIGAECEPDDGVSGQSLRVEGVPPDAVTFDRLVPLAFALANFVELAPFVESEARGVAASLDAPAIYFRPFSGIDSLRLVEARRVVEKVRAAAQLRKCIGAAAPRFVAAQVPKQFLDALNYGAASVYQVGPKQQVQVVSTQARAAEELTLAASLAGQAPNQGIGASAAFGFGRRAVGRADALERVPLVVGYADSASEGADNASGDALPSFGWMMGPRVVLDPAKQKLLLEQGLRPQELSVDLIVPGWWPYLTLVGESTWSPQWKGRGGKTGQDGSSKTVRVVLAPTSADFEQITSHVLGGSTIKIPHIDQIEPRVLPACATGFAIQLRGPQLWRATRVVIGGTVYQDLEIEVLPGLEGVLVKNVTAEAPVIESLGESGLRSLSVTVLTPYGPAHDKLELAAAKDGGCGPTKPKPDTE